MLVLLFKNLRNPRDWIKSYISRKSIDKTLFSAVLSNPVSLRGYPSARSRSISGGRPHLCLLFVETISAKHLGHSFKCCCERQHELLILVFILSCKENNPGCDPNTKRARLLYMWKVSWYKRSTDPGIIQSSLLIIPVGTSSNFRIKLCTEIIF